MAANAVGPGYPGRVATYWHMLPQADQARKAIWEAVNPKTSMRRIDEAFPHELRAQTRDSDMFIRFKSGSTYQVVGSDNFESLIGSPPAGIVFSEWAKAKPQSWAMLSPILAENKGWALFIYTPRGRNHGLSLLERARKGNGWFGEVLTVEDTGILSPHDLEQYRQDLIGVYGADFGEATFRQEMLCDFSAPILGAVYGLELAQVEKEGRIRRVEHDPEHPVFTAWDLGYTDDTSIWWYQVIAGEIRVLEFYEDSGKPIDHYASQILGREVRLDMIEGRLVSNTGATKPEIAHRQAYVYRKHWLPHDAKAKTLASGGKSIIEQLAASLGGIANLAIVPNLDVQDGIQAARLMFKRCYFDEAGTADGIELLRNYQREWDDKRREFKDAPKHDFTSHAADAFRMLAVAWRQDAKPDPLPPSKILKGHRVRFFEELTLDEMWERGEVERGRFERV